MSITQIKNLQRRLANLEAEAVSEVTRACGHELWQSLGFDALDCVQDPDRRARAIAGRRGVGRVAGVAAGTRAVARGRDRLR